jgi:hypothetical protein
MGSPDILLSRTAQSDKGDFSWIAPECAAEDGAITPPGRMEKGSISHEAEQAI